MDTDIIHAVAFLGSLPLGGAVGLVGAIIAADTNRWWPLAIAMPATFFTYPALVALLGG